MKFILYLVAAMFVFGGRTFAADQPEKERKIMEQTIDIDTTGITQQ